MTDFLHRPMAEAAAAVGERIEPQIDQLFASAFDEVMGMEDLGGQRRHDALSLAFQLTAIMAAKGIMLLEQMYPDADMTRIWTIAQTDLQFRTSQAIAALKQQSNSGRAVQ